MRKETMISETYLGVRLVACRPTDGVALHADFKDKVCHLCTTYGTKPKIFKTKNMPVLPHCVYFSGYIFLGLIFVSLINFNSESAIHDLCRRV